VNGIEPLFEFGFGLSYTKFEYFGLHTLFANDFAPEADNWLSGLATSSGRKRGGVLEDWCVSMNFNRDRDHDHLLRLHCKLWTVKFKLQNVGTITGTEVPQLYVAFPESAHAPPRVLRGFENVMLTAGETDTVEFKLSRYDLSVWSVEQQAWVAPGHGGGGEDDRKYILHVGASSRNFRLKGSLSLA
jgi:beta-glucosidase